VVLAGIPRAFKEGSGVFFGTKSTARQIPCPAKLHAAGRSFECRCLELGKFAFEVKSFQDFTLVSLRLFPPPFNLFSKEIEAQRAGGSIKVDILALKLIALHKQVGF
jgi:hypothetical protein